MGREIHSEKKNIQARFHGTVLDVEFSVIFFNIICGGGEWRRSGSGNFHTLGSRVTQQLQVTNLRLSIGLLDFQFAIENL